MNNSTATASSPNTLRSDDDNNLIALLTLLLSNWKTLLAFALVGLILGVTYSRYVQQPTYQTDALVKVNDSSKGLAALGANISELVGNEANPVEDERVLIQSRLILEPVVKNLNLDIRLSNPEIGTLDRIASSKLPIQTSTHEGVYLNTKNGQAEINQFEVPKAYLSHPFTIVGSETGFNLSSNSMPEVINFEGKLNTPTTFNSPAGDIKINVSKLPTNGQPLNITKLSIPSTIDRLNNSLTIRQPGDQTGFIELVMTGPDQQQITQVLNNIVHEYVSQQRKLSTEETTTTIKFMEKQIPELKEKLEQSEEAFNKFREQHGTIDVGREAELLLSENSEITRQYSRLDLKKAELLTYYTAQHPMVIQIKDQLASIRDRRIEIEKMIADLPSTQREFLKLSEDMGINREIYLTMLKNYQQLKIARAGQIGYVRIIDTPINTYNKVASKSPKIWGLALLVGTFIGALAILLKSVLRRTVKHPEHLETMTGIPVIASIPRSKKTQRLQKSKQLGDRLLAVIDHDSISFEAIKSLRTSLILTPPAISKLGSTHKDRAKVIVITGESPNTGKSFISANLTEAFGQLNKKVLLIDGDMRLGEQHVTYSVGDKTGLADYLSESKSLSKTIPPTISDSTLTPSIPSELSAYIHRTSFENIDLMPRGNKPNNPSSLLSSDHYKHLINELVNHYHYILIDTPPILAVSDAILMAQYADHVLMVSRYDQSLEGQTVHAIDQLLKAQVDVSGIVINDMVQGVMYKYNNRYSYNYDHSPNK